MKPLRQRGKSSVYWTIAKTFPSSLGLVLEEPNNRFVVKQKTFQLATTDSKAMSNKLRAFAAEIIEFCAEFDLEFTENG